MIPISETSVYIPSARAMVEFGGSSDMLSTPDRPIEVNGASISPWGENNDLPQQVLARIAGSDVTGANLDFNIKAAYGQGIVPMMRRGTELLPCDNDEINLFFEDNDINGFFFEQLADLMTFNNVFPQLIVNGKGDKIVQLSHLEAAFSRWGVIDSAKKRISKHYYYHGWGTTAPKSGEMTESEVLPSSFTFDALDQMTKAGKRRFVARVVAPTPGRTYYARPSWWSIFESGTYDLSTLIPKTKIKMLKNNMSVRYVVYISNNYWNDFLNKQGINSSDKDKVAKAKTEECQRIADFISNEDAKGGTLIATKETMPGGSVGKAIEDKHIVIETIKSEMDGELIKDSEEASNIICYAMGVHPSLIGATPGKNAGSLGGSDKRELFMVKQALLRPYRDRLLMPLNLIKRFNNWPKELVFALPEYQFPTLDKSSSGQQIVVQNP